MMTCLDTNSLSLCLMDLFPSCCIYPYPWCHWLNLSLYWFSLDNFFHFFPILSHLYQLFFGHVQLLKIKTKLINRRNNHKLHRIIKHFLVWDMLTCFNITLVAGLFSSIFESLSLTYKFLEKESLNASFSKLWTRRS